MKAPTDFVQALREQDLASAEELLPRTEINLGLNESGWTALHYLVEEGTFESAEWLLQHGADPNRKDKSGWTPLHLAVDGAADIASQRYVVSGVAEIELDLIKLLLRYGASPLAVSNDGQTPISIASDYQRTELVELLKAANTSQESVG
jgi:ankyrin repeat protein